ncbi:MAG: hypothetical protein OEX19_12530 [Gammaproteobacteria bacterium]|nr:hypothetical protein [Gammaproteobacteria bacterium]
MKDVVFSVLFFTFFLASMPVFSAADSSASNVNDVLAQAMALHKKAIANEGGWMITTEYIEKTKKLLAEGNNKKALEVANRAREYAELSEQQAEEQKKNWSEPPYIQ